MKQFFQILCYGAYRNQFIWHSPRESRLHSAPENECHTAGRKICLKYKFCTMFSQLFVRDVVWEKYSSKILNHSYSTYRVCCQDHENISGCFTNPVFWDTYAQISQGTDPFHTKQLMLNTRWKNKSTWFYEWLIDRILKILKWSYIWS